MKYCRTNEAIKWLNDGDVVENLSTNDFFKKKDSKLFISQDTTHWREFEQPIETFPPYVEWRSITNLHYYDGIQGDKLYLTSDDRIVSEDDPESDKNKKRWFVKFL